jgi:glycosyltransferase involved in cell wall biosynthesis
VSALTRPAHLIPGDPRHGVARYAGEIAEVTGCAVWRDLDRAQAAAPRRLHLHFSDRLWAADPAAAARRVEALARHHSLTVTLHDLPQPSDGPDNHRRRADCYRQVIAAARGVVCNSNWEAGLVAALPSTGVAAHSAVIPLPVDSAAANGRLPPRREIGVIGFVYPGKGHEEAIDAAAALAAAGGSPVAVVALGAVSAGHVTTAEQLDAHARRRGVAFSITGYLTEAAMLGRARQVLAPVAAHQHLSASGSIGSWLAAGRRPLVADSSYAREIDHLRPGTIRRYRPDQLAAAISGALADPASTWLAPDAELKPGRTEVGAAYLDWWTRGAGW